MKTTSRLSQGTLRFPPSEQVSDAVYVRAAGRAVYRAVYKAVYRAVYRAVY